MLPSFLTAATAMQLVAPVLVAMVMIAAISILAEPARQGFSAIFLAGAGAAYLSGGFGVWEFAFCAAMTLLAYAGLSHYRAIAAGWLLHTGWDGLHHLHGNPIIPFAPTSSLGCAICDPVLALWYAIGAPSVWKHLARLFGRARQGEAAAILARRESYRAAEAGAERDR